MSDGQGSGSLKTVLPVHPPRDLPRLRRRQRQPLQQRLGGRQPPHRHGHPERRHLHRRAPRSRTCPTSSRRSWAASSRASATPSTAADAGRPRAASWSSRRRDRPTSTSSSTCPRPWRRAATASASPSPVRTRAARRRRRPAPTSSPSPVRSRTRGASTRARARRSSSPPAPRPGRPSWRPTTAPTSSSCTVTDGTGGTATDEVVVVVENLAPPLELATATRSRAVSPRSTPPSPTRAGSTPTAPSWTGATARLPRSTSPPAGAGWGTFFASHVYRRTGHLRRRRHAHRRRRRHCGTARRPPRGHRARGRVGQLDRQPVPGLGRRVRRDPGSRAHQRRAPLRRRVQDGPGARRRTPGPSPRTPPATASSRCR